MIEVIEANIIAKQLNEVLPGKIVKEVIAGFIPHGFAFFSGNKEEYSNYLNNKVCGETVVHGGIVELEIEDYLVTFSDGTNLRYYKKEDKKPTKHQFYLGFEDETVLALTISMYGHISVFKKGENDNIYYLTAKKKPSPLSNDFNYEYFNQLKEEALKEKINLSLKEFLATKQRIPGLGNGTLHDILFNAALHPKTKLNKLTLKEFEGLYTCLKETLEKMLNEKGKDTEKDIYGISGGYKTVLSAKTYKQPCPKCHSEIIRQAYLGGNIYFCSNCQKEVK